MGKHSGRNALNTRLQQLGFDLSPQEVDDVFRRFKVGGPHATELRLHGWHVCCQPTLPAPLSPKLKYNTA